MNFSNFSPFLTALLLGSLAPSSASAEEATPSPTSIRVFYFGNSLTQSSQPPFHKELAKSAGKNWECVDFLGAGWQTWQHRNEVFRALGRPLTATPESMQGKGDLTLDIKPTEQPHGKAKRYLQGDWDAIVIQIFGSAMDRKTREQWGQKFDQEINVGDVVAATDIIKTCLEKNPNASVFIYSVWPPMQAGKVPPDEELPEWAKTMKAAKGKLREAEFPDRAGYDWEKAWSAPYLGDMDEPWKASALPHWRTRDYTEKVFEGIKANFPQLYAQGRLHHLPGGELFSRLNKKMQAGEFPGISSIKDFYTDVQHVRAGAANYSVAALFYTGLFKERADNLNYQIYNEQSRYGKDENNDFGAVIEITPERAQVIHETIWELLKTHPQANLKLKD